MTWQFEAGASAAAAMTLGALLLASVLARLEWRRPGRHRGSRVAAAIVCVLALLALALGPTYAAPSGRSTVTVLTPGAQGPARGPSYAVGANAPGSTAVPDLAWLLRHRPDVGRITVRGWGLDDDEWPDGSFPPVAIQPEPAPEPAGITGASWPAAVSLGDELVIHGRAHAACGRCALVLSYAGVPLDSVPVGRQDTAFTLRARPRAAGRWRPVLSFSPRDAAPAETLSVEVRPAVPPRVLLVDASPSFESRFLKDWLGRQGATVAVRTQLGRARVGVAAINATPQVALDTAALARWDVMVLRASSLAARGADERHAVAAAVRDGGLGLVLVVDTTVPPGVMPNVLARVDARWLVAPARGGATRRARLVWNGGGTWPVVVPDDGVRAPDGPGILAWDEAGRAIATVLSVGAARLAVSRVPDAARWMLAGDSTSYAAWWSHLLGAVRVEGRGGIAWSAGGGPWFVDRPVTVQALAAAAPTRAVLDEAGFAPDTLALVRDAADSSRSLARFRPHAPGWFTLGGPAGLSLFAYDTSRWQALQAHRRLAATRARAGLGAPAGGSRDRRVPLRWPFFVLFVAAMGWLWLCVAGGSGD